MDSPTARPVTRQQSHLPSPTAACEACRKLKMRCIRPNVPDAMKYSSIEPCDRCKRTNRICKIPSPRPLGRKRGAVGRYHGLEKAYRKMQTELKKVGKSTEKIQEVASVSPGEGEVIDLLLSKMRDDNKPREWSQASEESAFEHQMSPKHTADASKPMNAPVDTITSHMNFEPVSNPLALMAEAAGAAQALETHSNQITTSPMTEAEYVQRELPPGVGMGRHLLHRPGYVSLGLQLSRQTLERGLDTLFGPALELDRYSDYFRSTETGSPRDVGPDLDPVELGLLSMEEAYTLFPIYFSRLHLINGILDPVLHTADFVRSRSSLLFTWILALTAQFDHNLGHLAKRLRLHGEKLSRHVHTCGYKSVEIVQGYYISLLSATPARTLSEERSWLYTMYAFGVAAELGLDQGSKSRSNHNFGRANVPVGSTSHSMMELPAQEVIPASPSLYDATTQLSPDTSSCPSAQHFSYLQRLARNKERTWLRILLWERANSAACGRINAFPETDLTRNIEIWWTHPLADLTDKHTCAFILLRRHLATLQKRNQTPSIEKLPNLYLYHVYIHNRLWTLSSALNVAVKSDHDLDVIREDCFDAAIHCCEIAVRDLESVGEPMYCMLSPTWAMISYAAVLTLKLFPYLHGSRPGYEIELLALLGQVAIQLKSAGTIPSHRFGIAALLGQHLLVILRSRAARLKDVIPVSEAQVVPLHSAHKCNNEFNYGVERAMATDNGTMEFLSDPHHVDNPLVSAYDPFLTAATVEMENDFGDEGFTDLLREIFGPGFGDVF
ncbi:hypothetical protein N7462_001107 [Penicillium macrosclerotiorum]|uniref:uncharacterized protein n=1 Tax=Penicillium macrosclerotiorum TaxID=303699 RepID=UPI0025471476|nr:uncharacterized protein N7462_001107 [Penicillium macrosclerotiorum]KAJ5699102.1 hypothetical protein N7462_001107 [Penicillium macrosclerotiorum]